MIQTRSVHCNIPACSPFSAPMGVPRAVDRHSRSKFKFKTVLDPLILLLPLLWALSTAARNERRPCDVHEIMGPYATPHPTFYRRSGILLWSWGRCGTGSLYETLLTTAGSSGMEVAPVCGIKEGLPSSCLRGQHVDRCLSHIPHSSAFFTHIKPKYLHGSEWRASGARGVLAAMQERGAKCLSRWLPLLSNKVVVVVQRNNWLARDISAMEMHIARSVRAGVDPRRYCNAAIFKEAPCPGNCVETFRKYQRAVDEGAEAARQLGLRVVPLTFNKQDWPCGAMAEVVTAAAEEGVLPRVPAPLCVQVDSHNNRASHLEGHALEDKVGACVAAKIRRELTGSEFEWMLDISKESPPEIQHGGLR